MEWWIVFVITTVVVWFGSKRVYYQASLDSWDLERYRGRTEGLIVGAWLTVLTTQTTWFVSTSLLAINLIFAIGIGILGVLAIIFGGFVAVMTLTHDFTKNLRDVVNAFGFVVGGLVAVFIAFLLQPVWTGWQVELLMTTSQSPWIRDGIALIVVAAFTAFVIWYNLKYCDITQEEEK